ncbi:hypothetical protein AB7318_21045 [Providencia rettgeri]
MFKDGLATKTDYVTVYNYNENGEFTGESTTLIEEGTGIPAQSTLEKVNKEKKGFARVFKDGKWTYFEDHRGAEVYDINTKQKEEVKYLGALKPEHTTIAPPSQDHDFVDGQWILTEEKKQEIAEREREAELARIQAERAKLMQEMQYHMLLGEEDKAREIALKIKELE